MKDQEPLAADISIKYQTWNSNRATWLDEKRELREYIVATDTTKTTNAQLPWKNKTTLPKLTQIRDNLHANYMAALFPNDNWLVWIAEDEKSALESKRKAIEAYSRNKLNTTDFKETVSSLVYDYVDYGNAFGMVVFDVDYKKDPKTEENIIKFIGPRVERISPLDIVFNPTSKRFEDTPKIIRSMKSIGELLKDAKNKPELRYDQSVLDKVVEHRQTFLALQPNDQRKASGYKADGFNTFQDYFASGYVEILEFFGDIYSVEEDKLYEDYIITVADGMWILRREANPSWLGEPPVRHIGWRKRSDNLWAMGPLDNLVGMQYRIDHLENLKADVFDLIAYPVLVKYGDVLDFEWGPGETIQCDTDGRVEMLAPNAAALNADVQILELEKKMEEFAGAPKEAMGFRTPGEKTKYEMQVLERGVGRIFNSKTSNFEAVFIEPLVNTMFEQARRNFQGADIIGVLDEETGVQEFLKITPEDIKAKGRLKAQGARHFAEDAKFVQEVTGFLTSVGQDPGVRPHVSGKEIAKRMLDKIGLSKAYGDNIFLEEQLESQKLYQQMQNRLAVQQGTETQPQPEDYVEDQNASNSGKTS